MTRVCVVGMIAALALPLGAQQKPSDGKPVFAIDGPQGIGLRVEPIPADAPRFEAASIKRDSSGLMPPSGQGQLVSVRGTRVFAANITVRELIRNGYNLQHVPRSFVAGGPDWIDAERYNVEAVSAAPLGPTRVRNVPPPAAAAMIRSLLADRFKFTAHNETREERIYELVLDRSDGRLGPKLTASRASCLGSFDLVDLSTTTGGIVPTNEGKPYFCPFMYGYGQMSILKTDNLRIRDLAMFLGLIPSINAAVVDRTGVTGRFDIELQFAGEMILSPNAAPLPREVSPTDVPPLQAALRQQLGLRLQSTRGPVEVVVIDHIERPSEN